MDKDANVKMQSSSHILEKENYMLRETIQQLKEERDSCRIRCEQKSEEMIYLLKEIGNNRLNQIEELKNQLFKLENQDKTQPCAEPGSDRDIAEYEEDVDPECNPKVAQTNWNARKKR